MNTRRVALSALLVIVGVAGGLVFAFGNRPNEADEPKANPDQEAVHKALESFAAAFNSANAEAAASVFTASGEYIDDDGNRVEGPAAIKGLFAKFFAANSGAKVQITPKGVRTVAPGVALEDGESVVTVPNKSTQSTRQYAMVYAKINGSWKIASIREYPEDDQPDSAADKLKSLEFLIGDWVDEGGDSLVSTSCKWSPDRSHIIRDFAVHQQNKELLKGTQRIGVDPLTNSIKAWAFDSTGGYGESTWTPNGAEWLIRGSGVTGDGDMAAATYILKPLSKDRIELKTMHKVVADSVAPDSTTILVRKLVK